MGKNGNISWIRTFLFAIIFATLITNFRYVDAGGVAVDDTMPGGGAPHSPAGPPPGPPPSPSGGGGMFQGGGMFHPPSFGGGFGSFGGGPPPLPHFGGGGFAGGGFQFGGGMPPPSPPHFGGGMFFGGGFGPPPPPPNFGFQFFPPPAPSFQPHFFPMSPPPMPSFGFGGNSNGGGIGSFHTWHSDFKGNTPVVSQNLGDLLKDSASSSDSSSSSEESSTTTPNSSSESGSAEVNVINGVGGGGFGSWMTSGFKTLFGGGMGGTVGGGAAEIDLSNSWGEIIGQLFSGQGLLRIIIDIDFIIPDNWKDAYASIPEGTRKCIIEEAFHIWQKHKKFNSTNEVVKRLEKKCPKDWEKVKELFKIMKADFEKLTKPVREFFIMVWKKLVSSGFHNTHAIVKEYYDKWIALISNDKNKQSIIRTFPKFKFFLEGAYAKMLENYLQRYGNGEIKGIAGLLEMFRSFETQLEQEHPGIYNQDITTGFRKVIHTDLIVVMEISGENMGKAFVSKFTSPVKSFVSKIFSFG
ncbi:hypothetical protein Ddc_08337 [Ditylenchus destructor]|nr:hypothetical protein Ddc_08337 [Ditylenchus destructor]